MEIISASQAAKLLGVSIDKLVILEKQGLIHSVDSNKEGLLYSSGEIAQIKARRGPTLSEEAAQVNIGIQREIASSVTFTRKVLLFIVGTVSVYIILVAVFAALFIINPLQTAQWLGIVKSKSNLALLPENQRGDVLGAETSGINGIQTSQLSPMQAILYPASSVSLGVVKNISPESYSQIAQVIILDPNDVLTVDTTGTIIPELPINFPQSSLLQIGSTELVKNLNAQLLQGKQPGENIGDIAIVGSGFSSVDTLADVVLRGGTAPTPLTLSNNANNITAGTLTVTGGTINGVSIGDSIPATGVFSAVNGLTLSSNDVGFSIAGGADSKTLTTNNDLTLVGIDGTKITFQGADIYIGRGTTDTLSNKTISAKDNTISGLTNVNLSGSAGITNANLANSTISISGNSGLALVALGGTLALNGSGITNITATGSALTITTTEADTLQSVYGRGNTITTSTSSGIIIDSSDATITGTISGLDIAAPINIPTNGTYNSLNLRTSTSSAADSYDQATITVGNIDSTAVQNFATLNIGNGGTGYLDIEVNKGFINFQGMNTLYEDFTGKALDTVSKWTSTSTGVLTKCSIMAGGLNGLFRMRTGPGNHRGCELTTQAISFLTRGYYRRSNNPIFETKLQIDTTTNAKVFAGFTDTRVPLTDETNENTNHAYIAKKAADTTWQCVTDDGGAVETVTDTNVTIANDTFYRLRVELRNGTTPETICTIDDGTTITRTIVTTSQPAVDAPMDVYIRNSQSDAVIKNMYIDYVRVWQSDSNSVVLKVKDNTDTVLEEDSVNQVIIKSGEDEVGINFAKEFASQPKIDVSFNPTEEVSQDEVPDYSIQDVSTKGFKIKLAEETHFDLHFFWTALPTDHLD